MSDIKSPPDTEIISDSKIWSDPKIRLILRIVLRSHPILISNRWKIKSDSENCFGLGNHYEIASHFDMAEKTNNSDTVRKGGKKSDWKLKKTTEMKKKAIVWKRIK